MLRKIGDFNHKYPYRVLVTIVSAFTDIFPFALSDLFLWALWLPVISLPLIVLGMIYATITLASHYASDIAEGGTVNLPSMVILLWFFVWFLFLMLLNYFRTPYWEKMELKAGECNPEEEFDFALNELRKLDPPTNSTEQMHGKMLHAVRSFTIKWDGYDFRSVKRVKRSLFSDRLRNKMHIGGLFNPLLPELVVVAPLWAESVAHEAVHSRGHFVESQTVFNSTIALITYDDAEIRFWGYFTWLHRALSLMEYSNIESFSAVSFMEEKETPNYIIDIHTALSKEDRELINRLKHYTKRIDNPENTSKNTVWSCVIVFALALPILVVHYFRELVLKILGQKDTITAYESAPLQYLAAYRRKFIET